MTLKQKTNENIVGKGENAGFLHYQGEKSSI